MRHLNALVRTILFVELFYGFQADPIVEKALKVWHKELLRVSGGTTSPLEVSGACLVVCRCSVGPASHVVCHGVCGVCLCGLQRSFRSCLLDQSISWCLMLSQRH